MYRAALFIFRGSKNPGDVDIVIRLMLGEMWTCIVGHLVPPAPQPLPDPADSPKPNLPTIPRKSPNPLPPAALSTPCPHQIPTSPAPQQRPFPSPPLRSRPPRSTRTQCLCTLLHHIPRLASSRTQNPNPRAPSPLAAAPTSPSPAPHPCSIPPAPPRKPLDPSLHTPTSPPPPNSAPLLLASLNAPSPSAHHPQTILAIYCPLTHSLTQSLPPHASPLKPNTPKSSISSTQPSPRTTRNLAHAASQAAIRVPTASNALRPHSQCHTTSLLPEAPSTRVSSALRRCLLSFS